MNHVSSSLKTVHISAVVPKNTVIIPQHSFFYIHPNYDMNLIFVTDLAAGAPSDVPVEDWVRETTDHIGLSYFFNPAVTDVGQVLNQEVRERFKEFKKQSLKAILKAPEFRVCH